MEPKSNNRLLEEAKTAAILYETLQTSRVNPSIVFSVIRGLANLSKGSGFGKVTVEVNDNLATFVKVEEASKLNEKLLVKEPENGN